MPISGLEFEKETEDLTKEVLDFFEKVRYAYLSARNNPSEYSDDWAESVEYIKEQYDSLSDFSSELKDYVDEKIVFDKGAKKPESVEAKKLFEAVKDMRFRSDKVTDPFSKKFGEDDVIPTMLENESVLIAFLHYALRSHSKALPNKAWDTKNLDPDEITDGFMGLDLDENDLGLYIIEHYGKEDEDNKRIESKVKNGLKTLKDMFLREYEKPRWDNLLEVDIKKEEKSDEEKAEIDFIVPNKPMYRIFELEDMESIKGLSGDFLVQEKYDGMRIQLHKKGESIKVYSYNKKDISDACKEQIKKLKEKQFGDCILDAELVLFDGDEPLHRADTITHVFKKKKGGQLRAHVFDIMHHEGTDLHSEPLRERINTLLYQFSQHSSEQLAFPSKKDTRMADSIKEVGEYAKDIMELPASEGVLIKDLESTYYIGNRKNPKWIKWKKFVDLDVIVLDKKSTKSGMKSYTLGVGPVTAEVARTYKTTEYDDKEYLPVGKALNTKENVDVGSIVRVKVDEVKKNKQGFTLYSAKLIEIPEVDASDKVETLEQLASKTKKSLSSDASEAISSLNPFKLVSGVTQSKDSKKTVKKGFFITDGIHGKAEVIAKSEFDGFTIYGFDGDSLMAKNALYNIDVWKKEMESLVKSRRSELRIAIRNEIIETYDNKKTPFGKIVEFVKKEYPEIFEDVFSSSDETLMGWMKEQESLRYHHPNKFTALDDVLEKDVEEPEVSKVDSGRFSIMLREDGNLDFILKLDESRNFWMIDITELDDVYDLFGKSQKFPAIVGKDLGPHRKEIDSGDVELGVQREGYHEYKITGDKFDTRFHVRVVPLDEKKTWVVWTGKKQEMLDLDSDENLWDITEDKYAKLELPE